jgi:chromate transporter
VIGGFAGKRFAQYQPDLIILALSALAGAIYYARLNVANVIASALPLAASRFSSDALKMTLFFLKLGLTLFGSGYVLISYLESGLVDHLHWLTRRELLDAIAVGQVTPGPLLTTATFIGYLLGAHPDKFNGGSTGGILAAILATVAIFAPSFVLIALLGPMLQKIRSNRFARGGLKAMNAAVVALIAVVCCRLGAAAFVREGHADFFSILIAAASLLILLRWSINATWLILAAGLLGLAKLVI